MPRYGTVDRDYGMRLGARFRVLDGVADLSPATEDHQMLVIQAVVDRWS